ncbi:MAG: flagellar biosynthesis protein [Rhodobacteraceae bacterium PARR1]|nr:MAG: flagellar biosynthesis protein [Rhodobacteraceae bacterium PARR1]
MPLRLETFAADDDPPAAVTLPEAGEEARFSAYDDGYAAGWEDALAARDDDAAKMRDAVGQGLQTLGFSYHEARMHVLQSLRPLLETVVAQLLPRLASDAIGPTVADVVMTLAADCADQPVTLRLHPLSRAAVEGFLTPPPSLPLALFEDSTLTPGQVMVQAGPSGARVDMDGAIAEIAAALAAFYEILPAERRYG